MLKQSTFDTWQVTNEHRLLIDGRHCVLVGRKIAGGPCRSRNLLVNYIPYESFINQFSDHYKCLSVLSSTFLNHWAEKVATFLKIIERKIIFWGWTIKGMDSIKVSTDIKNKIRSFDRPRSIVLRPLWCIRIGDGPR